jgi:hypothetical protein
MSAWDPPSGCRHCGAYPEALCCAMALCAACGAEHWREEHREPDEAAEVAPRAIAG